jgi:hypothetical protein
MSELMNELIEQLICEWLEMERNINCRGMTRDEMFACAEKEWPKGTSQRRIAWARSM